LGGAVLSVCVWGYGHRLEKKGGGAEGTLGARRSRRHCLQLEREDRCEHYSAYWVTVGCKRTNQNRHQGNLTITARTHHLSQKTTGLEIAGFNKR